MSSDDYTEADVDAAWAATPPRIVAALQRLGIEHEPPIGWEARVLSSTVPPRGTWLRDLAWSVLAGLILGGLVSLAIAWIGGWL